MTQNLFQKEIKINEEQINIILKSFRSISNEIQKHINKKNELSSQRKRKSKTKITPSDNIRNEEIRNLDELSNTNEQIYSDESSDYDKSEFDSSDDESTDYTDSEYDDEYIYSSCSPIYPKPNPEINSGLINWRNTCYINSALQIIFQLPYIEDAFKAPKEQCSPLAKSLAQIFISSKESEFSYNPIEFIKEYRLSNCLPKTPQDSLECFINLMQLIESNFNVDISIYTSIFVKEIECENGHQFMDMMDDPIITIQPFDNVHNDLQKYITNLLNGELYDTIVCPDELIPVYCRYTININKISPLLFSHIDRYYFSTESQNAERLPFNLEINNEIEINSITFQFKAALLHFGSRLSGHYNSLIKHKDNYYLYNDAKIDELENFDYALFNENYELLLFIQKEYF